MTKLLTGAGGEFQLDKSAQSLIAYAEDGSLYISKSHAFNAHVMGFIGRLKHLKRNYRRQLVDMSVIAELYANQAMQSGAPVKSNSQTQNDAMELFKRAVDLRSSDIHVRVTSKKTIILFRIHGDLEFIREDISVYGTQLCSTIYQAMTDISDPTFQINSRQDARISDRAKLPHNLDGIRVATTPQVDGSVMVMRLLYNDTSTSNSLTELGFLNIQDDDIGELRELPTGINIIAGSTGSGKSTTLQRILGLIYHENDGKKHIITVEDPPEYPIFGSVQTPVSNAETDEERSTVFQNAIRSCMRLDPDILMIGEMRDPPSAKLAVQAAMTGHQVWSTLHANSAFGVFDRLIDMGIPPALAFDHKIISGLLCQRLLKKLCSVCKKPLSEVSSRYKPKDLARVTAVAIKANIYVIGDGCDKCRNTGTDGRTCVAEVVKTDSKMTSLLRSGDKEGAIDYWRKELCGISIIDSVIIKVNAGEIDPFMAEKITGPLVASSTSDRKVVSES